MAACNYKCEITLVQLQYPGSFSTMEKAGDEDREKQLLMSSQKHRLRCSLKLFQLIYSSILHTESHTNFCQGDPSHRVH